MHVPQSDEQAALANCDREPVHSPGRVQSFGALLAYQIADHGHEKPRTITAVSENFAEITGIEGEVLGKCPISIDLPADLRHELNTVMGYPKIAIQRERLGTFQIHGRHVDVAAHRSGDNAVVEFEPLLDLHSRPAAMLSRVRMLIGCLSRTEGTNELLQSAVDAIRRLTGFDRVMGYQFLDGAGDGEVVAESRSPAVEPFLGLRYPASDIPAPARAAMLRMPFRCIPNVDDPHRPIHQRAGNQRAGNQRVGQQELDLTLTHLKGVSPIHLEYLQNMGVRSTMNVPIIVEGRLWGLIALHHHRPKLASLDERSVLELFGQMFSVEVQQMIESGVLQRRRDVQSLHRSLFPDYGKHQSLTEALAAHANETMAVIGACGMALVIDDQVELFGKTLSPQMTLRLMDDTPEIMFIDELSSFDMPGESSVPEELDFDGIAGVCVIPIHVSPRRVIVLMREEEVRRVRWAGHPEKRIEFGPSGPRLHPRASFDEYIDLMRGRSQPWSIGDIAAASELRNSLLELSVYDAESSRRQLVQNQRQQQFVIRELNHRIKNILALVQSIANQSFLQDDSANQSTDAFGKRIEALAVAHDMLAAEPQAGATIESLLTIQLRPYIGRGSSAVTLRGPTLRIRADAAPLLALLMHELTTNAVKHGALREPLGELIVQWQRSRDGVSIEWRETSTQPVPPPTRNGFGSALIKRVVPEQFGGTAAVETLPTGFHATFWMPAEIIQNESADDSIPLDIEHRVSDVVITEPPTSDPNGQMRCLLVEDEVLLSMDIERTLTEQFGMEVHCAVDSNAALALIDRFQYSVAVLDICLGVTTSQRVADELIRRHVPVLLTTGFVRGTDGSHPNIPATMQNLPVLHKPIDHRQLIDAMVSMLPTANRHY